MVPRGHLCVYELTGGSRTLRDTVHDPTSGQPGAARTGFMVWMYPTDPKAHSFGTWAVKAS